MALPTTAAEVELMMQLYNKQVKDWQDHIYKTFIANIWYHFRKRVFLQRPHTDDMMQMLTDMGIDPPDFQPISYDGLTFRWKK